MPLSSNPSHRPSATISLCMPFEAGARLGPYEIIAPIGAGGMGEIYRARDTRLDRTVAVKTLTGAAPKLESPMPLFQTHLASGTNVLGSKPQYDVARDGRFLLNTAVESASAPIVVSLNWIR